MSVDRELVNLLRDIERFKSLTAAIRDRHSLTVLHEIIREAEQHRGRLERQSEPDGR